MKNWFNDFVHNCLVHPLMPFMPVDTATKFHDWHATKIWGENKLDEIKLEKTN